MVSSPRFTNPVLSKFTRPFSTYQVSPLYPFKPVKEKSITEKPARGDRAQQAARRQLTICEREIAKAEERIAALDADMEANACDYEKLNALVAEKEAAQADLDALYLRWEELSEAAGEV